MFDFKEFRLDGSLYVVPLSWIETVHGEKENSTKFRCFWPPEDHKDNDRSVLNHLIRQGSEPDFQSWIKYKGKYYGNWSSYEDASKALLEKRGTVATSSEIDEFCHVGDKRKNPSAESTGPQSSSKWTLHTSETRPSPTVAESGKKCTNKKRKIKSNPAAASDEGCMKKKQKA